MCYIGISKNLGFQFWKGLNDKYSNSVTEIWPLRVVWFLCSCRSMANFFFSLENFQFSKLVNWVCEYWLLMLFSFFIFIFSHFTFCFVWFWFGTFCMVAIIMYKRSIYLLFDIILSNFWVIVVTSKRFLVLRIEYIGLG